MFNLIRYAQALQHFLIGNNFKSATWEEYISYLFFFESFYFEQIIPGIQLDSSKINSFTYYKETLKDSLKPVAMKCLKFKNLILVLANFELNISESFLLIFNEFCQFVKDLADTVLDLE